MTIRYTCVECNSVLKIRDEKGGTTGHCPKCKAEFIVPANGGVETAGTVAAQVHDAEDKHSPAEAIATGEEHSAGKEHETVAAVATTSASRMTDEELEDEYQRILTEGGDSPRAARTRRAEIDSDMDLTTDRLEDRSEAGIKELDTSVTPDSTRASSTTTAKKPSAAEISTAMMKNKSDPTLKKTGKAFGEGNEKQDARKRAAAEARAYYAKQVGLLVAVVMVGGGGLYWLMSSMMGGVKYPPLGRVSGTLTLDGKPLPGATVAFVPIADGPGSSTKQVGGSIGTTDKDGHYDLVYVQGVHGAAVGKHIVQIRANNEFGLEIIPAQFNVNSQMMKEVKSGSQVADLAVSSTQR